MAISAALLTNGTISSGTDATSYATSSLGTASGCILAFYEVGRLDSTQPAALTGPSGQGLSWFQIAHYSYKTSGGTSRLSAGAWLGYGTPSAGQITWTIGYTASGFSAAHIDITGALNTSSTAVQYKTATASVSDGGSISAVLDNAASDSANRCFAALAGNTSTSGIVTPRASWTELSETFHSAPNSNLETQWRSDAFEGTGSATQNDTGTTNIAHGLIIVEIAVATGAPAATHKNLAAMGVG